MKAMQIIASPDGPTLVAAEVPRPQPGKDQVLIRVYAAGVTRTELSWYPSTHDAGGAERLHAIPGHEFSGMVAAVGGDVSTFRVGDEVFGMNDWNADGATAEYCLTGPQSIALKPKKLTHIVAATLPLGGLTAWQGLFDRARLEPGERVLVHGGAGAVGLFAVQLARQHGAYVVATASARNISFVKQLGADEVIDYRETPFEQAGNDFDVVFDTVGGDTLARSWAVLKPGGRMVTIVSVDEQTTNLKVKDAFFIVEPSQTQLVEIAKQIGSGTLKTFIDAVVPLVSAPAAYAGQIAEKRGYGKIVISIIAG